VEGELEASAPSGDEAGFRLWASAREPILRRKAHLLCGDWHLADDLVQDTLVAVYARWPRLVRQGWPDAYSSRVLVTRFIDDRRRPWRRESPTESLPDEADPRAARDLDAAEPDHLLAAALRAVPSDQRAVLVLRYADDLSLEAVADLLNLSIGTVKSRAARGAERLRAELAIRHHEGTTDALAMDSGANR
jgi:RNA polymerase sigma-70 factor (sigma-E family)